MKIVRDVSLTDFEFWGGAKELAEKLSDSELEQIESCLEDGDPEGFHNVSEINDFFWYEGDTIAEWLGYESEEEILMRDDAVYLLGRANDLLESVREDNYNPEFCLDDVIEWAKEKNMSYEDAIRDNYKAYCEDQDIELDEETDGYIKCELLGKEIEDIQETLRIAGKAAGLLDITERIENVMDLMYLDKDQDRIWDKLKEDIDNCTEFEKCDIPIDIDPER